jgi:amino acid permease
MNTVFWLSVFVAIASGGLFFLECAVQLTRSELEKEIYENPIEPIYAVIFIAAIIVAVTV